MTTTTARPAAPLSALDEHAGRLLGALGALDGVGLGDELRTSRQHLVRADELRRASRLGQHRAEDAARRLAEAVADGKTGIETAAVEMAALAPWLAVEGQSVTPAGRLTSRAVTMLRDRAVRAARDDAPGAHKALARQADAAVRDAVDAGRLLVDVKAIAGLLKAPKVPDPELRQGGWVHPWVNDPPVMPRVDIEAIMRDGRLAAAWSTATSATERVLALKGAADRLCAVSGGTARIYPEGVTDSNVEHFVEQLPQPVHLAVTAALGWQPGLHWSMVSRPGRPRVAVADWAPPAPVKVGPHGNGWSGGGH